MKGVIVNLVLIITKLIIRDDLWIIKVLKKCLAFGVSQKEQ